MSDTPRTNYRVKQMIDNGQSPEGLEYWARELERELNAANERIKRMEEDRIDKMARLAADILKLHRPDSEAKESKP